MTAGGLGINENSPARDGLGPGSVSPVGGQGSMSWSGSPLPLGLPGLSGSGFGSWLPGSPLLPGFVPGSVVPFPGSVVPGPGGGLGGAGGVSWGPHGPLRPGPPGGHGKQPLPHGGAPNTLGTRGRRGRTITTGRRIAGRGTGVTTTARRLPPETPTPRVRAVRTVACRNLVELLGRAARPTLCTGRDANCRCAGTVRRTPEDG
jgi:hypothetical protein